MSRRKVAAAAGSVSYVDGRTDELKGEKCECGVFLTWADAEAQDPAAAWTLFFLVVAVRPGAAPTLVAQRVHRFCATSDPAAPSSFCCLYIFLRR